MFAGHCVRFDSSHKERGPFVFGKTRNGVPKHPAPSHARRSSLPHSVLALRHVPEHCLRLKDHENGGSISMRAGCQACLTLEHAGRRATSFAAPHVADLRSALA